MANILFQNALKRVPQKTPPIWFMRQAGRYHSHYQKLKEKYDFMTLCKEPELAAKVALGPVADFDFDVSILFSDLLFPLEALGLNLYYDPGPKFSQLLDKSMLNSLSSLDEAKNFLQFQKQAMQLTRELLPKNKSLIGFVGGPWTLFNYAVSGEHDGNLIHAKVNIDFYKQFSEILLPVLVENIKLQLDGGAEIVMIFDTAAGAASPSYYQNYLLPDLKKLSDTFSGKIGYYAKGTTESQFELVKNLNWAGLGVDHRYEISKVLKSHSTGFLQGNFDQALLFSEPEHFKNCLLNYIAPIKEMSITDRAGWVSGLGHGVLPKTPEANVRTFIEVIRKEFS